MLWWLGHVSRIPIERLPHYARFSEAGNGQKMGQDGQSRAWKPVGGRVKMQLDHWFAVHEIPLLSEATVGDNKPYDSVPQWYPCILNLPCSVQLLYLLFCNQYSTVRFFEGMVVRSNNQNQKTLMQRQWLQKLSGTERNWIFGFWCVILPNLLGHRGTQGVPPLQGVILLPCGRYVYGTCVWQCLFSSCLNPLDKERPMVQRQHFKRLKNRDQVLTF